MRSYEGCLGMVSEGRVVRTSRSMHSRCEAVIDAEGGRNPVLTECTA